MSPGAVREHWQREPFRPIRIHLFDGATHDIVERGYMYLDTRQVVVGVGEIVNGIPERSVYLDPVHITRIEPIGQTPSNGNGRTRG